MSCALSSRIKARGKHPNQVESREVICKALIYGFFALLIIAVSTTHANAFSKIIVFGDSLSDSGNVYIATGNTIPASPYYDGRFTNGPNYVDLLASNLGLNLKPVLDGGTSYAVGSAKTANFPDQLAYSFLSQVEIFRNQVAFGTIDKPNKDALYVVFIGSNDMLDVIDEALANPGNQSMIVQDSVSTIVGDIKQGLNSLKDEGAFNILIPYLPNLARTPRYVQKEVSTPGTFSLAASATMTFNQALDGMLNSFSDINIIRFNSFQLLEQAFSNAAALGFTNVSSACYTGDSNFTGGGNVCADPNGYAFWDTIHPSTHAHSILEQEMYSALNGWFGDVFTFYWAHDYIKKLNSTGITKGCGNGFYCPEDLVTRAEMAVFIERGINGSSYLPSPSTGIFVDVPTSFWAADWIEQFYQDGITDGCGNNPPEYCPEQNLTRAEMAVFLLRAKHGSGYSPPQATGVFEDVPADYWAAAWVEQLYLEGITTGCSETPLLYCPDDDVTRAQMAAFLVRTFGL